MNQSSEAVVAAVDLRVGFPRRRGVVNEVVHGLDLTLRRGQVTVLLGESGSGKTVFARSLAGMAPRGAIVSGQAMFDGIDLVRADRAVRRSLHGSRIGSVAQDPTTALDPMRRVGAQMSELIRRHRRHMDAASVRQLSEETLLRVELRDPSRVLSSYPHELSGGMRQRVCIAMAVSCRPEVIIADEPSSALDASVGARIVNLLSDVRDDTGVAILFITHDIGVAARIASRPDDQVAVLLNGSFMELGTASAVWSAPAHAYTRALIGAEPSADTPRGNLPTVPDWMRRTSDWGPLRQVGDGHWAANSAPEGEAAA